MKRPIAMDWEKRLDLAHSQSPGALPRGNETILLVDDYEELRNVLKRRLSELGYQVLCAANGKEALEILSAHSGTVHLIVTDIVMPGMSGLQLSCRVVRLFPHIKVIIMSSGSYKNIAKNGLVPFYRFLQKPFGLDEIARTVREVLDQKK